MRLAVTGGNGKLATALRDYFPQADYLSRQSVDVANAAAVRTWFSQHTYDCILHAGAVTAHNADPAALTAVNVVGTANIVHWARKQNARLVYTSTDYVYEGKGRNKEDAPLQPHGHYAWSKLGGEACAQSYASTLIIRGSWYEELRYLRAAHDAYTSKIPVTKAAGLVASLVASRATGVVNVGGERRSYYEICVTEFNPNVMSIPRHQVQGVAYALPKDVSLDCGRMRSLLNQ